MTARTSSASIAVEDRLFRALTVLRFVVLLNSLALSVYRSDDFERPVAAVVCVGVMLLWTGVATWAYADRKRRTHALLAVDLVVAVGLLVVTPLVKGEQFTSSLPGFWVMSALIAWAIHYRWAGGLIAGLLLATTDLVLRQDVGQSDYGNAFLLLIGGPIIGYMCGSLQEMATERDAAERAATIAAERARLARAVHDGVLQVLALVQRHGRDRDGEAADLGRLAGEQEAELRALIRAQDLVTAPPDGATIDLTAELARLEREGNITVSTPDVAVALLPALAHELVAAVRACLDNTRRHVGADAPAWVLLQALPDRIEISVRDAGPGIPPGRLDEAEAQGRLGVRESIRGRLADLGGTAELTTGSFGTEWELVVPLGSRG